MNEHEIEALANDLAGLVADDVHQAIFNGIRSMLANPETRERFARIQGGEG